jgi:tetratricopeptide (TPR) repeat protein
MATLTRPLPAPPRARGGRTVADRVAGTAGWIWALVALGPPLAVGLVLGRHRIRLPRRRPRPGPQDRQALALAALDGELRAALLRRLGSSGHREGAPLAAALRAAGVEASLAQHVARVRDRLQHAVFGPPGVTDPEELAAEVHEVLRALAGEAPGAERRQLVQAMVLLAVCVGGAAGAQAPRPEELYAAGAFRAAADSFAARVTREPRVPAYWYALGAAYYRLGEDGRARAAWIRAARLAPRDAEIHRALALLPADPAGRDLTRIAPFRPAEALLVAAGLWVLGWAAMLRRSLRRAGLALVLAAVAAAFAGWQVAAWSRRPVAIVLADDVALRGAPYGSAEALRPLAAGDAVRVRRQQGPWLLVARPGSVGWVQVGEVARL